MDTRITSSSSRQSLGRFVLAGLTLASLIVPGFLGAAELKEGRVTQVIKDVKLLPEQAAPRPAVVNDKVQGGTAVRTGADSRTELTFADLTIARLGANTIFSVNEGSRTIDLGGGAILVRVPKDSGGAKISTAAVTAAITGTTMMAEYHKNQFKFIMLEGTARICRVPDYRPNGAHRSTEEERRFRESNDCVELQTGQMLAGRPGEPLAKPVEVDLRLLTSTSPLLEDFGPLGSEDLIARAIAEQQTRIGGEVLAENTGKSDLTGIDSRDQMAAAMSPTPSPTPNESPTPTPSPSPSPSASPTPSPSPSVSPTPSPSPSASPTPSPSPSASPTPSPSPSASPTPVPTPNKYGTPPVIASPTLSVIDNATTIQTDPSISRNGETDYGRIYRNPSQDGPASTWMFGTSSSFDQSSGFDQIIAAYAPFAAFKFPTLTLVADPTISTTGGGVTSLALIGVGGINPTDDGERAINGANLIQFTGIQTLLLATQAGSINLGSNLSFFGINTLLLYARGTGSDLNLGSEINSVTTLALAAEQDVNINAQIAVGSFTAHAGRDFNVSDSGAVRAQRLDIFADRDLYFATELFGVGKGSVESVRLNGVNSVNILVNQEQSVFSDALSVDVSGGTINLESDLDEPRNLTFSRADMVKFSAGLGGIQASTVFFEAANLQMTADGDINIDGAGILPNNDGIVNYTSSITTGGNFLADDSVDIGTLTAGGSITVGGHLFGVDFTAGSAIDVTGSLSGFGTASAGGDITAYLTAIPNISTPGMLTVGQGGIHPFVVDPDGSSLQHTITAAMIVSPAGIDFSGNQFYGTGGLYAGGRLTLNVNSIRFDAEVGVGAANFDGADGFGDFNPPANGLGGDGGIFRVNSVGSIFVGETISATTGQNDPEADAFFSGAGGQVTLETASGLITVNSLILVSSDDGRFGRPDGGSEIGTHESASGGNIFLHSGVTSGAAITLNQSSQLYSLLNAEAPGPGGTISVITEGGNILAAGAIEADRGTIFMSNLGLDRLRVPTLNDVGVGSTITIDGASLIADDIDVRSAGDINVGTNAETTFEGNTVSLLSGQTLNLNAANTSFSNVFGLSVSGGTINLTGGDSEVPATIFLDVTSPATFDAGVGGIQGPTVQFSTTGGLNLLSEGDINIFGADIRVDQSGGVLLSGTINAAGLFKAASNVTTGDLTAGGSITVGGDLFVSNATAGTTIDVTGSLSGFGTITAGGDISTYSVTVPNIVSPTGTLNVGAGGINPFAVIFGPGDGSDYQHTFTIFTIDSGGILDFDGTRFDGISGLYNGGKLTINADHLLFDSFSGNGIPSVDFDGAPADETHGAGNGGTFVLNVTNDLQIGDQSLRPGAPAGTNVGGFSLNGGDGVATPSGTPVPAGSGGTFTANVGGDIFVVNDIEATTGSQPASFDPAGTGGNVTLASTNGTVSVDSRIEVSSNDPPTEQTPPPPRRRSAAGGNIHISSGKSGGAANRAVAIDIGNSAQLLSLLSAAAPGPGGKVVISASGANSDVNVAGRVQADRGTVDIRHTGAGGNVTLDGGSDNLLNVAADVVKVAALGDNGVLRVGGGSISADTTLQLYATGFNGEVRFISNVSLLGSSVKSIAGNAVTVVNGAQVNVGGPAANVYVNSTNGVPNANYSGSNGGNGSTTGTFTGSGVNPPQPLNAAPPLGSPPPRPGS